VLNQIKKHLTLNNLILVAAFLLAGSWALGAIGVLNHNYDLERQVEQAKLDNQIIELTNQNLKLQQAYFQTAEYLDLEARALLGKASAGEHLVILPNSDPTASTNADQTPTASEKSNLEQWLEFLFGSN
jgi:apolipoprotein N-acyltransferase